MVLPKKILRIKDLTFILPEEFEGDLKEAIEEFVKYREAYKEMVTFITDNDEVSSTQLLFECGTNNERVCGEYGLFALVDGSYKIIQGSEPDKEL